MKPPHLSSGFFTKTVRFEWRAKIMAIWAVPSTMPVQSCPALTHHCGFHSHAVRSSAKLLQLWNLLPGDRFLSAPFFFFLPAWDFWGEFPFLWHPLFLQSSSKDERHKILHSCQACFSGLYRQHLLLSLIFQLTMPGVYSRPPEFRAAAMEWMDLGLIDTYVEVPVWLPPTGFWSWLEKHHPVLQTQSLSGLCLEQEEREVSKKHREFPSCT